MNTEAVPFYPLRRQLQIILDEGGVDEELLQAVGSWRDMVDQNQGKPYQHIGNIRETTSEELVDSLAPLLLGVSDPEEKAKRYFVDGELVGSIGDKKFAQRASLWERMITPYWTNGIMLPTGEVIKDVGGVVEATIVQLLAAKTKFT